MTAGNPGNIARCALFVSILALGVSTFAAYQSRRSATAAVANVRPILNIDVVDPVVIGDKLPITFRLTNIGKGSASVDHVHLVVWDTTLNQKICDMAEFKGRILRPGEQSEPLVVVVPRYFEVNNAQVDIAMGGARDRRLRVRIAYRGRELNGQLFEEDLAIPVSWQEVKAKKR